MKSHLLLGLLLLFSLISCSDYKKEHPEYGEEIYKPSYSKGFEIKSLKDSQNHVISVFNPWQGSQNVSSDFFIIKENGENKFPGEIIHDKAERIVCMSSTHVAMLDELNAIDKIVGVSGKEYISNPFLQNSEVPDIGYEGNIDYEKLVALKPDLVLLFSVNGTSSMEPKLKELGIPFIYIGDYVEETPLGKVEWIIPVAEIIGKKEEGVRIFKDIEKEYSSLKNLIANLNLSKPKVMVNAPFADFWYMPSSTSYIANIIRDAGGDYIYKKDSGNTSMPIDKEEALALLDEADIWINTGSFISREELTSSLPDFATSACVKNGNIFNNNRRITPARGNDCYESGAIHPERILKDLIMIFHSQFKDGELYYYQQLK